MELSVLSNEKPMIDHSGNDLDGLMECLCSCFNMVIARIASGAELGEQFLERLIVS